MHSLRYSRLKSNVEKDAYFNTRSSHLWVVLVFKTIYSILFDARCAQDPNTSPKDCQFPSARLWLQWRPVPFSRDQAYPIGLPYPDHTWTTRTARPLLSSFQCSQQKLAAALCWTRNAAVDLGRDLSLITVVLKGYRWRIENHELRIFTRYISRLSFRLRIVLATVKDLLPSRMAITTLWSCERCADTDGRRYILMIWLDKLTFHVSQWGMQRDAKTTGMIPAPWYDDKRRRPQQQPSIKLWLFAYHHVCRLANDWSVSVFTPVLWQGEGPRRHITFFQR